MFKFTYAGSQDIIFLSGKTDSFSTHSHQYFKINLNKYSLGEMQMLYSLGDFRGLLWKPSKERNNCRKK